MPSLTKPKVQRFAIVLGISIYLLAAFGRGNFLFGMVMGLGYALVALIYVLLILREPKAWISWGLVVFTVVISMKFTFPATLNSTVQHFIEKQAFDRETRDFSSVGADGD